MTSNYDKTIGILRKIAKKTKSKIADGLLEDKDFQATRSVAYQLFDEAMELFCDGSMDWEDTVDDLVENLKAIDMPKPDHEEDRE